MKYSIDGVDGKSGLASSIVVEADSENEALLIAKSQGIFPSRIRPYAPPEETAKRSRATFGYIALVAFILGVVLGASVSASFFWLCALAIVPLLAAIDWVEVARQQQLAEERLREQQAQIICPHCQQKGGVTTHPVARKKGISGGKAAAAVITGGLSVLATGLSRKEVETEARCSNCGSVWHY